jgi:GT2 family glycosyltransferase
VTTIFAELYRSIKMRNFRKALRDRDISSLAVIAREEGLRILPEDAIAAARLLQDQKRVDAAIALLQNAILDAPGTPSLIAALRDIRGTTNVRAHNERAEQLARQADAARDEGNTVTAAMLYGEALDLVPGAAEWRVQRANMLKDSGEIALAEIEYRRAQLELPDDADIPLQLGRALKVAGRKEEALASFREALRREPTNRAVLDEITGMGAVQDRIGQAVLALERGQPFALFALADALAGVKGNLARIEKWLPSPSTGVAFPAELHDLFRRTWSTPLPPPLIQPAGLPAMLFDGDGGTEQSFFARLDALIRIADAQNVVLLARVADPLRRIEIERRASPETGRRLFCLSETTLPTLIAELAKCGCETLILIEGETLLAPKATGWFCAALSFAEAAYADGERGEMADGGGIIRSKPELRSRYDKFSKPDFGSAFALRSPALAAIAEAEPDLPATIAALGAAASARATPLHIPLFLSCDLGDLPAPAPAPAPASKPMAPSRHAPTTIGCVIPTRDTAQDAERFVRSLQATARQPNALSIIIVDNGVQGDGLAALNRLSADGITVVRDPDPFNWSRLNNRAAARLTEADILLFANDDMEMITPNWDDEIRVVLELEGVGALGAKLLYPDRTIQHAGILCSWAGRPEHEGRGEAEDAAGPAGRWQRRRSALAVTGAFLATKRRDYEALHGFDVDFPFGLNDVDYCLRLREQGLTTVFTPDIVAIHHESKTRGRGGDEARAEADDIRFASRWKPQLELDPTINPNWHEALPPFQAYHCSDPHEVLRYLEGQSRTGL